LRKEILLWTGAWVLGLMVTTAAVAAPSSETGQDASRATVDQVRQLVVHARALIESGKLAEAAAAAQQALAAAKDLAPTPESDVLVMKALEVNQQATARSVGLSDPTGPPANPAKTQQARALLTAWSAQRDRQQDKPRRVGVLSPQGEAAFQAVMQQIRRDRVPQAALLTQPKYPAKLSGVTPSTNIGEQSPAPKSKWEEDILKGLEQRVSFDFKNAPLAEVVDYLSALSGQNIVLDPRLGAERRTVSLKVTDMSLRSALKYLATVTRLKYAVRREAVLISSPQHLKEEGVMRIYDISDLLLKKRDFWGMPTIGGHDMTGPRSEDTGFHSSARKGHESKEDVGQGWANFIRNTVERDSWRSETGARSANTISYRGGQLVVTNTPRVQAKIQKLLTAFRESRALMVSIQTRFVLVSDDFLEQMGMNWVGNNSTVDTRDVMIPLSAGGGTIPAGFQTKAIGSEDRQGAHDPTEPVTDKHRPPYQLEMANLNDSELGLSGGAGAIDGSGGLHLDWSLMNRGLQDFQVHLLLDAVQKSQQSTVLTAPRITCFNTQRANIVVADEVNYVSSQSSGDEPEVSTLLDGAMLEVQPFVSSDRKFITIELRPSLNQLISMNERSYRATVETGDGTTVNVERRVQLPNVARRGLTCTVVVPVGGTLMIGGLSQSSKTSGSAGVPFLSQFPIVGKFFSSDTGVSRSSSLIVLVRADLIEQQEGP